MEIREVKIEEYWPLIVKNTEEFGQIAVAENPEFNQLAECIYRVLKDGFIHDATEYGVSRWENMLGLAVTADMTLDDRKAAILTYLSIKLPYTWRVLKRMLTGLLGEDNFEMSIDNDTQTVTIALALAVDHMRGKIDELCARVIPQNLVIDVDELPMDYTRVEFLESTGTQAIVLPVNIKDAKSWSTSTEVQITEFPAQGTGAQEGCNLQFQWGLWGSASGGISVFMSANNVSGNLNLGKVSELSSSWTTLAVGFDAPSHRWGKWGLNSAEDEGSNGPPNVTEFVLFSVKRYGRFAYSQKVRKKWLVLKADGGTLFSLIPALDPTGAPCMFDIVSLTPFYNSGTGDFLYPTDAAPVMTLDLDEKFYAKRTEHGIRRLYHVPEGCTMSKDEYAAKNGFKEILEPPMPLKGYWVPQWKETETQLICEWVETEPPTEEGIENE